MTFSNHSPFLNRELGLIEFNRRVLACRKQEYSTLSG
jgi:hypothetical protein